VRSGEGESSLYPAVQVKVGTGTSSIGCLSSMTSCLSSVASTTAVPVRATSAGRGAGMNSLPRRVPVANFPVELRVHEAQERVEKNLDLRRGLAARFSM
jgi:hypothetical protein